MTDPFATLGISRQFAVDEAALRQLYVKARQALSGHQGLAAQQGIVRLNDAYAVLRDPLERAACLLGGSQPENQPENQTVQNAAVLAAALEQREALAEARTEEDLQRLETRSLQAQQDCQARMEQAFAAENLALAREILLEWQYARKFAGDIRQKIRQSLLA
jgi:molecular chaperone HscB